MGSSCFCGFLDRSSLGNSEHRWVSLGDVVGLRNSRPAKLIGRYHTTRPLAADFTVQTKEVGKGQTGVVMLATDKHGKKFAVKSINKRAVRRKDWEWFEREVNIHFTLDHPHILRLEHVFECKQKLHLVTEYMAGGELFANVFERGQFSERDAASCVTQLLHAVSYLHAHMIIHRDLKLENILCMDTSGTQLKIIDFGLATYWDGATSLCHVCGTVGYLAPEVLKGRYTDKVDIWALGLVAYEVLMKHPAYSKDKPLLQQVKAGRIYYGSRFHALSSCAQGFLRSLLHVIPNDRPSAAEALGHPWLQFFSRASSPPDAGILRNFVEMAQHSQCKRICLELIASELSMEEQAQFEMQFNAIDVNKSGSISAAEFCNAMVSSLGVERTAAQELFHRIAASCEEITYSEFVAVGLQKHAREHEEACRAAFHRITSKPNSSHCVSSRSTTLSFEAGEMQELIREADANSDGVVSYEEFLSFVDLPPDWLPAPNSFGATC